MKKINKFGFTLAEVLIVIGVIGVVSAITIPTLIDKYKEHVTVNKVKKLYSMFSQAVLMSINNNGYPNEWNVENADTAQQNTNFANYIKPYLKIVKDCGVQNNCIGYDSHQTIKRLNDREIGLNFANNGYNIVLSDGTFVFITTNSDKYCVSDGNNCATINVDLNGKKEPNTIGKDIFRIVKITPKGVDVPQNNDDCRLNSSGWSCGTYILLNGNMDYLNIK